MTPRTRSLLTDIRRFLRAVEGLFCRLPAAMRASHLETLARELADRIDAVLAKYTEPVIRDA